MTLMTFSPDAIVQITALVVTRGYSEGVGVNPLAIIALLPLLCYHVLFCVFIFYLSHHIQLFSHLGYKCV